MAYVKSLQEEIGENREDLLKLIDSLLPEGTRRCQIGDSDITNLLLLAILKKLKDIERRLI